MKRQTLDDMSEMVITHFFKFCLTVQLEGSCSRVCSVFSVTSTFSFLHTVYFIFFPLSIHSSEDVQLVIVYAFCGFETV